MPPYRRYGPGVSDELPTDGSTDIINARRSGFEKVDVLAKALESLSLKGGTDSSSSKKKKKEKKKSKRRNSATGSISSEIEDDDDDDSDDDIETSTNTTPLSEENGYLSKKKPKAPYILGLPNEVLEMVFSHIPAPISVELLYVCRRFYYVGLSFLYYRPILNVSNYPKFVAAITGSSSTSSSSSSQVMKGNRGFINRTYQASNSNHGKDLGGLVRILDLQNIIQSGKNSYTARVLRRCSAHLVEFLAPQTSFGYSPLISLSACSQLKVLDLSLVSETVDLRLLFTAISNAQHLEKLAFPRSSIFCHEYDNIWPPKLWQLCLSGGICNDFIMSTTFPTTVTDLVITHCPFVNGESVRHLCARLGSQLRALKVFYPMPVLRPDALDPIFGLCPNLKSLSVSVDYISRHMFEDMTLAYDSKTGTHVGHGLRHLRLDSSGMLGQSHKLEPIDVSLAILDEKLPKLTQVQVSVKLGWNPKSDDMMELAEILSDKDGGVWLA